MNLNNPVPIKICIVSDQLAGGGAEKVSALLSIFFESKGIKVHHVIVVDKIEYSFAGEILNLGKLKNKTNGFFNKLVRLKVLFLFLRKNKFNFIIDTRARNNAIQEFIISKFIFNAPLIIVVHSFITDMYFLKNKFFAKNIFTNTYKIIAVSDKISKKITTEYGYKNVENIYNPIHIETGNDENIHEFNFKYILAVGGMNLEVKQFDKLILCYSKSILPSKEIKLVILGDGILKAKYQLLCKNLNLEDKVFFYGQVKEVNLFYKKALFTVLSSKNEGFPNVLIESLYNETPVISFDCDSGPSEIIEHKQNGLLIENQNEQKLIESMNEMVLNEKLYYHCKLNAKQSVARFGLEKIGEQWLKMMNL